MRGRFAYRALGAAGAIWLAASAFAAGRVTLSVGSVQGAGWRASGITVRLAPNAPAGAALTVDIAGIDLPEPIGAIRAIHVACPRFSLRAGVAECPRARVQAQSRYLEIPAFTAAFSYALATHDVRLRAGDIRIAGARSTLAIDSSNGHWRAELHVRRADAARLSALVKRWYKPAAAYAATGRIDLDATLSAGNGEPPTVDGSVSVDRAAIHDAAGAIATSGLAATVEFHARPAHGGWQFRIKSNAKTGEAYVEPVYVDLGAHPATLAATGTWNPGTDRLALSRFSLDQPGVLRASGRFAATLDRPLAIASASVKVAEMDFPASYKTYLQPLLVGTPLDALDTSGRLQAAVELKDNHLRRLDANLAEITLHDRRDRFALTGLDGTLHWRPGANAPASRLAWRGGNLLRFALGPAVLNLELAGNGARLLEPLRVPVFDGALDVDKFKVNEAGQADMRIAFDARLKPVSMTKISAALGWPALGGTLSGAVPDLSYRNGVLTLGGALTANVFGGTVTMSGLTLSHLFDATPTLRSTVQLRDIDLAKLTGAFSFGSITGKLDGDIAGLRLADWTPTAFDAHFATPAGDRSRHRISQQALKNLSSIGGGGAAGALSRGFIGLFSSFAYHRIGISCRLQGDICHMDGLAPAPDGGYYIVKGAGLPRVDVVGHSHVVSWSTLLGEIESAIRSKHPVVK